jgi:hypothetical protein
MGAAWVDRCYYTAVQQVKVTYMYATSHSTFTVVQARSQQAAACDWPVQNASPHALCFQLSFDVSNDTISSQLF